MSFNIKKNKFKKILIFTFLLIFSSISHAYVHSQTKNGLNIHWPASGMTQDIYVNSLNGQSLNEALVQSIASTSILYWNGLSQMVLRKNVTSSTAQDGFNELYFSTDANFFSGSGVVGVTQVGFREDTGEIVEADILVNDNFSFSTNPLENNYLGNVITHEVGHFLGLGHGQVSGSTMFYALSRGQNSVDNDDKAGIYSIYPNSDSTKGSLSGTIVGGKGLAKVFGAHVQAISVKTGKVMGASISEIDGKFSIAGLPRNDQYLLYTSPLKQLGLPANYANMRSDFCEASKKYRGSFFQSCGSSSEGFPQAVRLSTNVSSVDVGKITIRCGLDAPPEYIQNKSVTPAQFDINSYAQSGLGGSFVGFFSAQEMSQSGIFDNFKIDFSNVDWSTISSSTSLFLELKVTNQAMYSPFKAKVNIKRGLNSYDVAPDYVQEADGFLNIDTVERVSINRALSSDNDFEITVSPQSMEFPLFPSGIPYTKADLFPSYSDLQDNLYFYLVTATVVKANGDGTFTQVASKNDLLSDNMQCPDAVNTYALTKYTAFGGSSNSDRKKAAGCGTVDFNNGSNGSGPGGFMIGVLFCFILAQAISRYSKMA